MITVILKKSGERYEQNLMSGNMKMNIGFNWMHKGFKVKLTTGERLP